jgi:hypothetical protein
MFRRMRRAALQVNAMDPAQMQSLIKANQLVSSGQSGQAAPLYAKLANEMETNSHPRRAANLHAQAAHAYADSQNEQAALDQARQALTIFIQSKMINRIPVFYTNITRKFISKGMKSASETLAREFGLMVGPLIPHSPSTQPHPGQLPTNCTKCGAPIHKDEANWVDEQTIECDFCGSLIRSE